MHLQKLLLVCLQARVAAAQKLKAAEKAKPKKEHRCVESEVDREFVQWSGHTLCTAAPIKER